MSKKRLLICGVGSWMSNSLKDISDLWLDLIVINNYIDENILNYSVLALQCYPRSIDEVIECINKHDINNIDWVISLWYENLPVIAEIVEKFKLIWLSKTDAYNCTYKDYRIKIFSKNGIKTPKFVIAKWLKDSIIWVKEIWFPCVIKPNDKTSSIWVIKLEGDENIEKFILESLKNSNTETIIIEELLSWTEHTFEGVVYDDNIIITWISDRNYSQKEKYAPYFFEDGDTLPSILSQWKIKEIISVIEKWIKVLNLNNTAFHCDIMITNKWEIILLEMVWRISWARFWTEIVKLSTGIDILPSVVRFALWEEICMDELKKTQNKAVVLRYLVAKPWRIEFIGSLEHVKKMKWIYDIMREQELKVGDYLNQYNNWKDTLVSVIAYWDTVQEAENYANEALKNIPIEIF